MRKAKGIAAIFAGLLLMFRAGAITVSADEGNKGNNGDVKIHEVGTPQADNRNEPHVCKFYIDGFNFDKNATIGYHIDRWAPTGSGQAAAGTFPVNDKGNGRSADQTLPPGHYKLFAKQTTPSSPGGEKQKVFWVECGSTTANGEGNVPPTTPGNQNNGSNGNEKSDQPTQSKSKAGGSKSGTNSKSKKGGSATGTNSKSKAGSKNTKGGTVNGSVTGTHSVSKGGTKAGTKATNNASVASQGNNASGTNSMQTISREETGGTNTGGTNTGGTNTGGTNTGGTVTVPTGGTVIPVTTTVGAGVTVTIPVAVTLPGSPAVVIPAGVIPTGTTLPAGTVLPAGTTITGVLGFQSAPSQLTGAVSPEAEVPANSAVNGEQTSPVAGVTSLPSTSTIADNGIWGALGIMLTGIGAFLLRKPSRRLN